MHCRYSPFQLISACLIVLGFCFLPNVLLAQNKTRVTGRILDDSTRVPLEGITVSLKNKTTKGATTNINGVYAIDAAADDILVFTSTGYGLMEMPVNGRSVVDATLSSRSSTLSEVTVIGYGTRRKKDVTGAISQVGAKDIAKSTATTPELALQGRAAGVFVESGGGAPGARPVIRIRGVNTFGFSEPLYVVDGVPIYEGGAGVTTGGIGDLRSPVNIFTKINPEDIESMTVLKDASAAAIYGVRASNGVILITTKRGKNARPRVEYSGYMGTQNFYKTIPMLNTQQYMSLVRESYTANPDAGVSFEQRFGPFYDPSSPQYAGNGPTYDWVKDAVTNKNAGIQNHNVAVSGGSEGFTYYFSGGYNRTESPLKGNRLERYSVSSNIDSRISRWISAGMTIRLVQQNVKDLTGTDVPTSMTYVPFQPFLDPNDPTGFAPAATGSFVPNPDYDPTKLDPGAPFNFAQGDPKLTWGPYTKFNPLGWQKINRNNNDIQNILGNAYLQVEPVAGLKIKAIFGGEYFLNTRYSYEDFNHWRFSQTPGNPYGGQDANAKGSLAQRRTRTTNINKELTINYNRSFGDHNVDVLLGGSDQYANWFVDDLSGNTNFSDRQFQSITNQPPYTQGFANMVQEDQLLGYFGRLSYRFQDKYYLDFTMRRDGSSRLAPGNKWDNFPSISAAWRISKENFFPKLSWLNDLKLRGGWGQLGNFQSAGYYKYLSTVRLTPDYSFGSGDGNPYGTQLQGAFLSNFANTSLTWETTTTTSFGFDALMFNNSLSFTAEYYNKLTSGIIQSVSLVPSAGIQDPADLNIGEVRNSGFEFQVGYNKQFGRVGFNANANLTTVKNVVEELYAGRAIGGEFGRVQEGYSMNYLWGYKVGGIFQTQAEIDAWRAIYADATIGQKRGAPGGFTYKPGDMYFQDIHGKPLDPNKPFETGPDSTINANDRVFLGKTIPGFYYGFGFGANYMGFDISVFFQGVGDVQRYNFQRSGMEAMSGGTNQMTTVLDRWTENNKSTSMPRAVFGDPANTLRVSSRFVEDASYMRLKNMQIGYTIPRPWAEKTRVIQSLRIYYSGVNLFTMTPYTGLDPESPGIPNTRQHLFGINATF